MSDSASAERVIVLNPVSGNGDHADAVRKRAALENCAVRETEATGDAVDLARRAATEGASTVLAAGGDGTLHEVVRGVAAADALDDVTVGVLPAGTGNNFATNVGITDLDATFAALEAGRRRQIDLAWANDHPFVNSCVGGITADASSETDPEMKSRLGVLAYVLTTLRSVTAFDELDLAVTARDGTEETASWSGDALAVLAGNGRRFTDRGSTQADLEDGQLEVTIVEDVSALDLMRDAAAEHLLSEDAEHSTRIRAKSLEIDVHDDDPITFSLDGEIMEDRRLELDTQPRALGMFVGETYEPDPDAE